MPTTPEKRRLRVETISAVLNLSESDRAEQERRILDRVIEIPSYQAAESVLLYIKAFPEEIDTAPLLSDALKSGKRLVCPRVDRASRGMVLHAISDPAVDLRAGTLGIPEPRPDAPDIAPESIEWVLAPGVAFDARCNRVGRGAGHYDRLLPKLRKGVEVWAAAFDVQILDALPVEPHDAPLNGVVTATRILVRPHSPQEAAGGSA
ncbi:5-formyltetrahydrofolate cyclo-ligase [Paludisphaera rhizosphaerae]|uniref:5-formyltetrahydrofolate cyclo-ligase n=1 Tax=Paludisphaera rhizosphaerae TaxID=2711216 RepID=UPI0013ED15D4|nr:5-formyltetrahydrofolate cyclo-ligase [Paludisphaera rhizosphaerae]